MVEQYQGLCGRCKKRRQPLTAAAAFLYPAFPDFDSPVPADRISSGRAVELSILPSERSS